MFSQIVLTEDFEAGLALPAGWTNNDIAGNGEIWTFETGGEAGGFTPPNTFVYDPAGCVGNYAQFDSDGYGDNMMPEEAALESPVFDCSGLTQVSLDFNMLFAGNFGGSGFVETSTNGTTWTTVQTYTGDGNVFGLQNLDLTAQLAGQATAQIRFRWTGNWSISWTVDTISVYQCTFNVPNAATLVTPANGATGVPVTYGTATNNLGPWEWTPAATGDPSDSYNISLGTNPAGDDIGTIDGFDIGNSINFGWQPNTTYFWSIVSVNCAGESTASAISSFTTAACAGGTPVLTSAPGPADGAMNVTINSDGDSLPFTWTAGDPNDGFNLNLGTANPPTQTFEDFDNGGLITGLAENTTYFWSVDAINCAGTTPGTVWSFTTGVALSIDDNETVTFSVYPNPTNDILNIKTSKVIDDVTVYNLLGQNVATFKGNEIANNSIDISELSNGLYLVQISAGDTTQTIRVTKE